MPFRGGFGAVLLEDRAEFGSAAKRRGKQAHLGRLARRVERRLCRRPPQPRLPRLLPRREALHNNRQPPRRAVHAHRAVGEAEALEKRGDALPVGRGWGGWRAGGGQFEGGSQASGLLSGGLQAGRSGHPSQNQTKPNQTKPNQTTKLKQPPPTAAAPSPTARRPAAAPRSLSPAQTRAPRRRRGPPACRAWGPLGPAPGPGGTPAPPAAPARGLFLRGWELPGWGFGGGLGGGLGRWRSGLGGRATAEQGPSAITRPRGRSRPP